MNNEKLVIMILHRLTGGGTQNSVNAISHGLQKRNLNILVVVHEQYDWNDSWLGLDILDVSSEASDKSKALRIKEEVARKKFQSQNVVSIGHSYGAYKILQYLSSFKTYYCVRQDYSMNVNHSKGLKKFFKTRKYRKLFDKQNILTVSNGIAQGFLSIGVKPRSINVFYNPIPKLKLEQDSIQDADIKPGNYIVCVGNLSSRKNPALLLQAAAPILQEYKAMKIKFLGEGQLKNTLEKMATDLDIAEQVDFAGWTQNPYPYIKHAKVLAMTSNMEGFGRVLLEALLLGTPVVSTNCPSGPSEIMTGKLARFLVPLGDVKKYEQALRRAIFEPYPEIRINPLMEYDHCIDNYFKLVAAS